MKKYVLFSFIITLGTMMFNGLNHVRAATPPEPTYGTATVDGFASEWNLTEDGTGDYFATMYRAFKADKKAESKLYLRYDCKNHVLYSLVLTIDDIPGLKQPNDAWFKIVGQSGNLVDGNADSNCSDGLCFQWVYGTYTSGVDTVTIGTSTVDKVKGWEASAPLDVDTYKFTAHIHVYDDSDAQTSGTAPKDETDLVINCKPTAIELKSFKGKSGGDLKVELQWETLSETNNSGFNLYRARGKKGKFKQINSELIPAMGIPAEYKYEDTVKTPGNYFYKLEDVDNDGNSTKNGPIKVKVRKK